MSNGFAATISILVLVLFSVAVLVALDVAYHSSSYSDIPFPVVFQAVISYEQWRALNYSRAFIQDAGPLFSAAAYSDMTSTVASELNLSSELEFWPDTPQYERVYVATQVGSLPYDSAGYTRLRVMANMYVSAQKYDYIENLSVTIPIRYDLVIVFADDIFANGKGIGNQTLESYANGVSSHLGLNITSLRITDIFNTTSLNLSVRDCVVETYLGRCLTYSYAAQGYGDYPNLTF